MKILLDTNALIWVIRDDKRIFSVRDIILDDNYEIYVSIVSFWEIAIKLRLAKIDINLQKAIHVSRESGFKDLILSSDHVIILSTLPTFHKDPFDHMIISQAKYENMTIITGDKIFKEYLPDTIII